MGRKLDNTKTWMSVHKKPLIITSASILGAAAVAGTTVGIVLGTKSCSNDNKKKEDENIKTIKIRGHNIVHGVSGFDGSRQFSALVNDENYEDTDEIMWSLQDQPAGVSVNSQTGLISWDDNIDEDTYTFTLTVASIKNESINDSRLIDLVIQPISQRSYVTYMDGAIEKSFDLELEDIEELCNGDVEYREDPETYMFIPSWTYEFKNKTVERSDLTGINFGEQFLDITILPTGFCQYLFYATEQTTLNIDFVGLNNVTSVGHRFAYEMFSTSKINSLSNGFNLPSNITSVGNNFAYNMFYNSTNLYSLPDSFNLPGNINSTGQFFIRGIFDGSGIKYLPENFNLPAEMTGKAEVGFAVGIFQNCISLETLPEKFNFPSGITSTDGYLGANMFMGCSSLKFLPENFNFPAGIVGNVHDAFASGMFRFCPQLHHLPENFNFPSGITEVGTNFAMNMFESSTLLALPDSFNLPSGITKVETHFCSSMFRLCRNLQSLPSDFNLPNGIIGNVGDSFGSSMFAYCESLQSFPEMFNLPIGITKVESSFASGMFRGCATLSKLPQGFNFPSNIISAGYGFSSYMFDGCSELIGLPNDFNFPSLPASSVTDNFAMYMFQNCSALQSASGFSGQLNFPDAYPYSPTQFAYNCFTGAYNVVDVNNNPNRTAPLPGDTYYIARY